MKVNQHISVLRYIRQHITNHRHPPTQYEIAKALSIPRSTVFHRIQQLVDYGLLNRTFGIKRGLQLIDPRTYMQFTISGYIGAGRSSSKPLAKDHILDLADLLVGKDKFVLEVEGDSMTGDNIFQGDYIVCQANSVARENQIAAVLIDDENLALKRVKFNPDKTVTLLSSNPNMEPLTYPQDRIKIKGTLVGLIRLPGDLK